MYKKALNVSLNDKMLGKFLEQCRDKEFETGIDIGILSYKEQAMKKFFDKGISIIATYFKQLGIKIVAFIKKDRPMQLYIPKSLTIRESL